MSAVLIQPGIIEAKVIGFDNDNIFKALIAVRMDSSGNLLQFELVNNNLNQIASILDIMRCKFWEDLTNQSVRIKRDNDVYYLGHPVDNNWVTLIKRG